MTEELKPRRSRGPVKDYDGPKVSPLRDPTEEETSYPQVEAPPLSDIDNPTVLAIAEAWADDVKDAETIQTIITETKRKIVAAYEANDRMAARKLWGDLIVSIYPVLRQPPATGVQLRSR